MTTAAVGSPGPPLDEFLDVGTSTSTGEWLQTAGLVGSIVGTTIVVGLITMLVFVHRGPRSEIRLLLRVVGIAGAVLLVGAVVEIIGTTSVLDVEWTDALTTSSGGPMRVIAGVFVVLGLFEHSTYGVDGQLRWRPDAASAFGLAGAIVAVMSFAFDGHTVTEGPRTVHALANLAHVAAGGIWFGGIVGLVVVGAHRRRRGIADPVSPLVVRFSAVATLALPVVVVAGAGMALMILDDPGELTGSPWGRRLIIKTSAVTVAIAVGAYNHFVIVPRLDRDGADRVVGVRSRRTLAVEGIVLLFVAGVTAFLTTASTN